MKNYFETTYGILSFEKVLFVSTSIKDTIAFYGDFMNNERTNCVSITKAQFAEYKQWLEMKQKDLENKVNKPIMQMNKEMQTYKQSDGAEIPETRWLIDCWEFAYGRKFDSLVIDEIEDFLHDCLGILDYAGALNNENRGTLNDTKPEITEELIKFMEDDCIICLYDNDKYEKPTDSSLPCISCCEGNKFKLDINKLSVINKNWQEI